MAKAKITFEDVNENLVIGIENVISDNQTPAQKAALEYFKKIKVEIITSDILIRIAHFQFSFEREIGNVTSLRIIKQNPQ